MVQLRGDREAPYGDVVSVMDDLAAKGMTRIAIVSSGRRAARHFAGAGAEAMTDLALGGRAFDPPAFRPAWLRPAIVAAVVALHAAALSICPTSRGTAGAAERSDLDVSLRRSAG